LTAPDPVQEDARVSAPGPVPVSGLFEAHLTVTDLGRSVAFYRDLVGLPVALELPERGAAFHWIGAPGHTMLGLWSIGSAPMNMRLHIAFSTELDDLLAAPERLRGQGIEPLSFFGEPTDEPTVIGWMPAATLYFRDPDGHLLEYLTILDQPERDTQGLAGTARSPSHTRIVPWSQWRTD
jgi:lactoylglutathione lyase